MVQLEKFVALDGQKISLAGMQSLSATDGVIGGNEGRAMNDKERP